MVQSPSWEANWFAVSQEIPRISRNPKVHYCTHKRPPPVPILGQPNPVHISTSHLLEIYPNIIHPSTPRSPQWSLSLRFPYQDPIHPLLSHTGQLCKRFMGPYTSTVVTLFTWYPHHTASYVVDKLQEVVLYLCLNNDKRSFYLPRARYYVTVITACEPVLYSDTSSNIHGVKHIPKTHQNWSLRQFARCFIQLYSASLISALNSLCRTRSLPPAGI